MSYKILKTEHAGHKGSGRKSGFWGRRHIAKARSKKVRRAQGRHLAHRALRGDFR